MQRQRSARAVSGNVRLVDRERQGPVYYMKYRLPNGRQVQKKIGRAWTGKGRPPSGYVTKKMAEDALQAVLVDAKRGAYLPETLRGVTFSDVAEEWLSYVEHERRRKRGTVRSYRSMLDAHLLPAFEGKSVDSITIDDIDAYKRRLLGEGELSDRSINKLLNQLHAIFQRARRVHRLASNPVDGVERLPSRRSGDIEALTPDQVEALAGAMVSGQDSALIRLAAYTGLRQGELRALQWRDVDFARSFIHVRRSYTGGELGLPKSGKVRSVPLIDEAARALDGLGRRDDFTDPDDLVFPGETGSFLDDSALRRRFKAALKKVGLGPFRFHDLRHTFGTLAVRVMPLTDVQAYMGHADISTTMVYIHHQPRHDAAARLGQAFTESRESMSQNMSPTEQISDDLGADPTT